MSNLRIALSSCVLSLVLIISSAANAQFIIEELSAARDKINFPELTTEEKRVVAEQAQLILAGIYVHRFEKQEFYDQILDPVPAIQDVVNNIDSLSVEEMEHQIFDIFASQRDLHLRYIFPQPYASATSFLPLTLARTQGRRNFFEVRVESTIPSLFSAFAPDQRVPAVGDQVIAYNGKPIKRAVNDLINIGQGANKFGGFSRAVNRLTFAPQIVIPLPEEDEVTITFKTPKTNRFQRSEIYSITIPWLTQTPDLNVSNLRTNDAESRASTRTSTTSKKLTREELIRFEDIYQQRFTAFKKEYGLERKFDITTNPSNEPVLSWALIENNRGKFGYLKLDSFVPASGDDATIEEIRRLIYENFRNTRGLIFDVRGNGGGSGVLADKLPQLFSPRESVSFGLRILNTDVSSEIYNNSLLGLFLSEFRDALNQVAGTDSRHSNIVDFSSADSINTLGQLYNGPVAVLANSQSYSASDVFACNMQDSGSGFLFGEEPRTGAGGANVFEQSIFADFGPAIFEPLPATHRMRTSNAQVIRKGLNDGKLIEDFGCEADLLISPTKADLINGGEDQIDIITRALTYLSLFPRYKPAVVAPSNQTQLFRGLNDLSFPIQTKNTPLVRVTINAEVVDEIYSFGFGKRAVPVTFPSNLAAGTTNSVLIEGIGFFGKRLWNLKRQLIVLNDAITIDDAGFEISFATPPADLPFSIINQNAPEAGWNLVSPSLQVGFNPTYLDNVNTDALFLLNLASRERVEVSFDMEIDTEFGFDFIEVFVTDSAGNRRTLLSQSGTLPLTTYDFDISEFAGQNGVQLHFNFISDGGVVAPGVKLNRVAIR